VIEQTSDLQLDTVKLVTIENHAGYDLNYSRCLAFAVLSLFRRK